MKYKRILLKISGEAFAGGQGHGIDKNAASEIADFVKEVVSTGVQLVVVVGGGNIYRGSGLIAAGVRPADSHNMSMLSTVFNAVSLKNFLDTLGVQSIVLDALGVEFLERYTSLSAGVHLEEGKVVICSSGTGVPFFSTDTGGVLRALELGCNIMIKATKVDGVYDSDPIKNTNAQKIPSITYDAFMSQNLKVFDQTGIILARDNGLDIYVCKFEKESILQILLGENPGTKISF